MANWKKIITSGSNAALNQITSSGGIFDDNNIPYVLSSQTASMETEWDGTLDGDAQITGSLILSGSGDTTLTVEGNITGSGTISASGIVYAGGLDVNAGAAITLDTSAGGISIDSANAGLNLTVAADGDADDLTIQNTGAHDASVIITAAGTGTDAVSIDATAGDMLIAPNLINTKTLKIGPSSATQMVFTPHGTAASEKISLINTSGTADDAIKIDAESGGLTLAAGNDSLIIDADGTDGDALNIDSAGGIDVDAAGAIAIDAGTTAVLYATQTMKVSGSTGLNVGDDTATLDFDGSGGVAETGMTTISLTPSSTVDIDAGGAVTIDGSSITIGGDDNGVAVSIGHSTSQTTVNDNLTVTGDLTVNGTTTTIATVQLTVSESLMFLATGSAANNLDAGILVQSSSINDVGSALYHDIDSERWSVAKAVAIADNAITPLQFVTTVKSSTSAPTTSDGEYGIGEMWIDHDTSDGGTNGVIYIRVAD